MYGLFILGKTLVSTNRTLFLGDSHSCGYHVEDYTTADARPIFWDSNNYAEIYSDIHNKSVAVYAIPNGCNKKYPIWLRTMFDQYSDIDEVFIQSTYWNRDLLAANKNLDIADGLKSNHFTDGPNAEPSPQNTPLIERWEDLQVTENYIEISTRSAPDNKNLEYKGFNLEEVNNGLRNTFLESYAYTKLWHEHTTHLQYREYCSNLFIIDTLCKQYGVKWHLWSINERVVMPKDLNLFGPLDNCIRTDISAQVFIQQNHNYNIEDKTLDGEHYGKDTHNIIAADYIKYLKKIDKT